MKYRRLWSMLLAASLILCSCGNDSSQSTQPDIESVESIENETADEQTQETTFTYDYEQRLNIIDDNYRNYYEIFVYSFYDSNGDGIGDINGVIEKLDYIQEMGFNGIWLMPIMPSTTYHKYDVTNYCDVSVEYGSLEDFQRLLEESHERGIRVVIDFVMNHSSSGHPWFVEACNYLKSLPAGAEPDLEECPYVDYYHFAREQVNSTYYKVGNSEWYYEGVFWSEMPDLNLSSEAVKAEFQEIAKFWIDMGVDGFRMDAVAHFEESDTEYNAQVLNEFFDYCTSLNPDFYMVSEAWVNDAAIAQYYSSETPSFFNFGVASAEGKLVKAARGKYKAASFVNSMLNYQNTLSEIYPDYIDAPFIANHDMVRVANMLRNDTNDMKMACGLLMTMNGSPYVYYGEEIGLPSSGTKDENKRLPMIWSDTDTTGKTKGPKDADYGITSSFAGVEEQLADESSILNYYKRAIRLRNENPEIARGEIKVIEALCVEHQAVITKTYEGSTIAIVYNTSDEAMEVVLNDAAVEGMAIRGYLTLNGEVVELSENTLTMPAQSICILK